MRTGNEGAEKVRDAEQLVGIRGNQDLRERWNLVQGETGRREMEGEVGRGTQDGEIGQVGEVWTSSVIVYI